MPSDAISAPAYELPSEAAVRISDLVRRLNRAANRDHLEWKLVNVSDLVSAIHWLEQITEMAKDSARLNWLSAHRSPGVVRLTFDGNTIARAESVRDAIDAAMQPPNDRAKQHP